MKTHPQNLFRLIVLIVSLALMPVDLAMSQTFTFGPQVKSGTSASISYNSGTGIFQYTDAASPTDDYAGLPLTGSAASVITTASEWSASVTANLSARSMTATSNEGPNVGVGLFILINNSVDNYVRIAIEQVNYTDVGDSGAYGSFVVLEALVNGQDVQTIPLGSSTAAADGESYEQLAGGTSSSPATESFGVVAGVLTMSYDASTETLTGSYNGTAVGSYSLAGWGPNPSLTLYVVGYSGEGVRVPSGTDTASDLNVGGLPVTSKTYSVTTTSSPVAGGTTTGGGSYTNGQSVMVTAIPNACYEFVNWTEKSKVVSTDPSYTFTVEAAEALVANFTLKEDVIATASNPPKGGATTGKGTYGCDKPVTVKATAAAGYKFICWTVGAPTVSALNPYTFPAAASEELTANFADVSVPTVTITSPTAKEIVDTTLLAISGTSKNVLGVSDVVLTLNGNRVAATTTNNWTNWSASAILLAGANVLSANALSQAGNPSKTVTVAVENSVTDQAPLALAGLIGQVQVGTNAPFVISFGTATFEQFGADANQGSSVGNYTYTQTGPDAATLVLNNLAPPDQAGTGGAQFSFSSPTSAIFTNGDGNTGTLTLSPGLGLDVSSQSGWTLTLVDTAGNTTATTFGDGTFTSTENGGNKISGGYTSTQYGPMADMVVETNFNSSTGLVETNYVQLMFDSRSNGQWFATLYNGAGGPPSYASGTFTGAYEPNGLDYLAPESLDGMKASASPHGGADFTITFGEATFGQTGTSTNTTFGVANYTYSRTGRDSAILTWKYVAPPQPNESGMVALTFKSTTSADFVNPNGDYGVIAFSVLPPADYFAPVALPQAKFETTHNGKAGSASFNYGNSSAENAGTYTYAQFSPTVGMLINVPASGDDAGVMEYVQVTFNSPSGGASTGDFYNSIPADNYIEIGTFTFVK